jgi:hypothetical protein
VTDFDAGRTLAERFRRHAADHDHFNGYAIRGMADDWESGGVMRSVLAGYEDAPQGAMLQLRLLAGVFRLVLTDQAPELEPYYACLGGSAGPEKVWPVMRRVIADHQSDLREALTIPPQTNEVGRSAALLAGLFDLVAAGAGRRIRLLEVGASGGLNLLPDRYHYSGIDSRTGVEWSWGAQDSPVTLGSAISGPIAPVDFRIDSRRGCDPDPVDVGSERGRLLLTSFVWPFMVERHRRLAAALQAAAVDPPVVDRAIASAWLPDQLAAAGDDHDLTVVWQSITRMYWSEDETTAVEGILADHGSQIRLAHVAMEYDPGYPKPTLRTTLWRPGQTIRRQLVGTAHEHGVPMRVLDDDRRQGQ